MRVYLLWLVLFTVMLIGFRNWYLSLCALIIMVAFFERQDMPQNIAGIAGLNPFNILLASIIIQWSIQRNQEGCKWDMPPLTMLVLSMYILMITVGFLRALIDIESFQAELNMSPTGLFIDEFLNPIRYLIPAILVFDGCRSRNRVILTVTSIIVLGLILAVFIFRYIPFGTLTGSVDVLASRNRIARELGFHANDTAFIQVFIFWTAIIAIPLYKKYWQKIVLIIVIFAVGLSVGLCQSRGGFLALVFIAAVFATIRKPILLLLLIAALVLIPVIFPGITANLSRGVPADKDDIVMSDSQMDWDEISSGRMTNVWPASIDFVLKSPVIGYGRFAILRVPDFYYQVLELEGNVPSHPHNAYLEVLLDYGGIGFSVVMSIFFYVMYISIQLMRASDKLLIGVGTIAFVAVLDNFVIGISSRALLPRPTAIPMWCSFALALRLWQMRNESPDVDEEEDY